MSASNVLYAWPTEVEIHAPLRWTGGQAVPPGWM